MAGKSRKPKDMSPRIDNRRARHDYFISDKLETGIVLTGSEVKSVRHGQVSLAEGYALIDPKRMELWLHDVDIAPYANASSENGHVSKRKRKLLAHKREIANLYGLVTNKGTTLAVLTMYFKDGRVKVEIGVAKGKQQFDKREDIKSRDAQRDMQRAMTRKFL